MDEESTGGDNWFHVTVELERDPLVVDSSEDGVSLVSVAVELVVSWVVLEDTSLDSDSVADTEVELDVFTLPGVLSGVLEVSSLGDDWLLISSDELVEPMLDWGVVGDLIKGAVVLPHHCFTLIGVSHESDWAFTLGVNVSLEDGVSVVGEVVDVVPVLLGSGDSNWELGVDSVSTPPLEPSHEDLVGVTLLVDSENVGVVDKLTVWMRSGLDHGGSVIPGSERSDSEPSVTHWGDSWGGFGGEHLGDPSSSPSSLDLVKPSVDSSDLDKVLVLVDETLLGVAVSFNDVSSVTSLVTSHDSEAYYELVPDSSDRWLSVGDNLGDVDSVSVSSVDSIVHFTEVVDSEGVMPVEDETWFELGGVSDVDVVVLVALVVVSDVEKVVSESSDDRGSVGTEPVGVPSVMPESDDLESVASSVDLDDVLVLVDESSLHGWSVSDVEVEVLPSVVVESSEVVESSSSSNRWMSIGSELVGDPLVLDSSLESIVVISVVDDPDKVLVSVDDTGLSLWGVLGDNGIDVLTVVETGVAVEEVELVLSRSGRVWLSL